MNEREISLSSAKERIGDEILQLVSFNTGTEEFGIDILKVQEINRMVDITRVPRAPEFVEGIINLRGKVIPIIGIRKRFNMELAEQDKNTRIVVVDIVSEVLRIPASTIEPTPEVVSSIDSDYIRGVAKLEDRLLIYLDLSKILSGEERKTLAQI